MVLVYRRETLKEFNMLIRCGLLLLCLNLVRTSEYISDGATRARVAEFNRRFSLWPSVHNAARLMRVRREAEAGSVVQSEGGQDVVATAEKTAPSGDVKPPVAVEIKNGTKEKVASDPPPPPPASGKN